MQIALPHRRVAVSDAAVAALVVLLVATSWLRFTLFASRPLQLDEVWTGMLATRSSFSELARQLALDANAPLYSALAALWAQFAGVSNGALRSLPALLGCLAPLIALWPSKTLDRPTRLTWCGLLACWEPGILYSQEARPYTLALALAVANAAAFASLIRRPGLRSAWLWAALSCLLILTHYFGAILVAFQGIAYLAAHRLRALRTWPAALAFLPAAAALAAQAQGLMAFSSAGHAWLPSGGVLAALDDLAFILDPPVLIATSLWLIVAILADRPRAAATSQATDDQRGAWLAAACSAASICAAIALSFLRPAVVPRYLTVFAPGVLLGVALAAARFSARLPLRTASLVAIFAATSAYWAATFQPDSFSWERASAELMRAHPKRLVFMWDTPLGGEKTSLAGVGGFFFSRAGHPVAVDPVIDTTGEDPNLLLLHQAGSAPGTVIIWLYDLNVRHTLARQYPPRIETIDPRWRCENFGAQALGVIGCSRRSEPS